MSTKELAYSIFDKLTEDQLKGFIALFGGMFPTDDNDQARRDAAFERLESMRKHIPDLDEKKELAEYREEKYGV